MFILVALPVFAVESGSELRTLKCAKCHKLYDPADYDDEKWNYWMNKMRRKAHLSQDQFEKIASYCASLRDKAKKGE